MSKQDQKTGAGLRDQMEQKYRVARKGIGTAYFERQSFALLSQLALTKPIFHLWWFRERCCLISHSFVCFHNK